MPCMVAKKACSGKSREAKQRSHRIDLKGESMRRKNARPDLTPAATADNNPD